MDKRKRRETPHSTHATLFLGSMMMLAGAGMIIFHLFPVTGSQGLIHLQDGPAGYISRGALVIGGALLLIYRRKGNYFAVGMYAIVLGLSRVIRSIPGIFGDSDLVFYFSVLMVIIGGNLAVGGFNHLTIRTRNPTMMRVSAIMMLSAYLIGMVYLYVNDLDIEPVLTASADILWYLPLYVSLLFILSNREITDNIPLGRIRRYSIGLGNTLYLGNSITVSPEDAAVIKDGISSTSEWPERSVGNTTVSEMRVVFHTEIGDRDVVLNRISGKEGLMMSVVDDPTDSFVFGKRYRVLGFTESPGTLELRDRNGICAVLTIGGGN